MNTYAYVSGNSLIYVDPFGLAKLVSVGVSVNGQVGPFGIFGPSVSTGGGTSFGLLIPNNPLNWRCYQLTVSFSAFGGGGFGTFFGVGATLSGNNVNGSLPTMSTNNTTTVVANGGAGLSGGVTVDANSDGVIGGSLSGGNVGVGYGLAGAMGKTTTTIIATPTIGDSCSCD